jgi:hypothetical protein
MLDLQTIEEDRGSFGFVVGEAAPHGFVHKLAVEHGGIDDHPAIIVEPRRVFHRQADGSRIAAGMRGGDLARRYRAGKSFYRIQRMAPLTTIRDAIVRTGVSAVACRAKAS